MIEPAVADQFQPYLRDRERVRWTGRPRQGLMFSARDLFLVPFSVVWLGFVVFWEVTVLRQGAPPFFLLWGAMFLAVGLFFFVGRFFVDAWARSRTIYALTDERALVLRWIRGVNLLSADLSSRLTLKQGRDGRGNMEFGEGPGFASDRNVIDFTRRQDMTIWTPSLSKRVQFIGIDDVMTAYQLARPGRSAP